MTMTTDYDELDYEPLIPHGIVLSPAQVTAAFAIGQRSSHPNKRWSVYLNALALAGFEQWLQNRNGSDIQVDRSQCSILEPDRDHATTAVHHLNANGFNLCLVAIPSCPDDVVSLPKGLLDQSNPLADFYIPIAIQEELHQAHIQGWISGTALQPKTSQLETNRDGTYAIPTSWFEPDLDQLLFTLSCTQPIVKTTGLQTKPKIPLRQLLAEPATNVKRWLDRRIDDLTQDLEWLLIPTWQVAGALRGETGLMETSDNLTALAEADSFLTILKTLARQGLTLSPDTRAAYRTLNLGTTPLQLCILTTPLQLPDSPPEWSLTVILKPKIGIYLPTGMNLKITEQDTPLVEQQTTADHPVASLFTRVVGERHEQFTITLSQSDGTSLTLSPIELGEG